MLANSRAVVNEKSTAKNILQKYFKKLLTSLRLFVIISNVAARCALDAAIAQSVEHVIGNDEVIGPNPISSSINKPLPNRVAALFVFLRDSTARKGDFGKSKHR